MAIYCVMTCDIKESRKLPNWPVVVDKLEQVLKSINNKYRDEIVINFKLTVGDEFQGVLKTPKRVYDVYLYLKTNLPVGIYCGVGVGEIEKPNNKDIGTRGTAFYRAREALKSCKKKKRGILFKSDDDLIDNIINTIFHFVEIIERSWTKRQREIVSYYRLHPSYTYEMIGKHFSISRQSVYQTLRSANWHVISEGETLIKEMLEKIFVKQYDFTKRNKAHMLYGGEI